MGCCCPCLKRISRKNKLRNNSVHKQNHSLEAIHPKDNVTFIILNNGQEGNKQIDQSYFNNSKQSQEGNILIDQSLINSSKQSEQEFDNHEKGIENKSIQKQLKQSQIQKQDEELLKLKNFEKRDNCVIQPIERAKGCLFGAFLGDSIGSRLEGKKDIKDVDITNAIEMNEGGIYQLDPGQLTDDGELIIAQAQGILNNTLSSSLKIKEIIKKIIESYFEWISSNPFDFESTMQNSWNFLLFKEDGYARKMETDEMISLLHQSVLKNSLESQSNSFLMKQSPLAIFLYDQPLDIIFEFAMQDTLLTHCHPFCLDVSRIFVYSLSQLVKRGNDVRNQNLSEYDAHFEIYCECRKLVWNDKSFIENTKNAFIEVESLFSGINDNDLINKIKPREYNFQFHPKGHLSNEIGSVKSNLQYCLMALLKDEINVEDTFKEILQRKGATGTDLCIVGALVGARCGINMFDQQYLNIINNYNQTKNEQQKRVLKYSPQLYDNLASQLLEKGEKETFILSSDENEIKENETQIEETNGNQYEGKNIVELKNVKIDCLQNCEVSRVINCSFNNIINCFLNLIEECEINNVISSRMISMKATHITYMNNCLVESNEGRIDYDKTTIDKHVNSFFSVQVSK